jgi:hypothetical protein
MCIYMVLFISIYLLLFYNYIILICYVIGIFYTGLTRSLLFPRKLDEINDKGEVIITTTILFIITYTTTNIIYLIIYNVLLLY